MSDPRVDRWLSSLSLTRYASIFQENEIDWDVLCELSDQDLRAMAVPLGHRKKMLRAIATLGRAPYAGNADHGLDDAEVSPLSSGDPAPHPWQRSPDGAEAEGGRRQISVMFCDLVGSTALSLRLDPEELLAIVQSYQRRCAAVVDRYEGIVAQYLGDGILAYFGYPQAREHDAERAVRAALDIIDAMAALDARYRKEKGFGLAVRIGIATGVVVISDRSGGGPVDDAKAIGETPNIAARLQAVALPNTVFIGATTHNLVASRFECEPLRDRSPAEPDRLQAWRVLRPADGERRFGAERWQRPRSLVGRRHALAHLASRWQMAREGKGQVVLLSGEAGIGKSHLVCAFGAEVAGQVCYQMRFFCSVFFENSQLHPVIERIARSAGFTPRDDVATRRRKLSDLVTESGLSHHDGILPALTELLDLGPDDRGDRRMFEDVTPQKRRQIMLGALMELLRRRADFLPTFILVEDAQWIDPTTRELLHRAVEWIPHSRAMLVVTCRPGFEPDWADEPHVSHLTLSRLSVERAKQLVAHLSAGTPLPPDVVATIVKRADGVPLFVEELTKTVLARSERPAAEDDPVEAGRIASSLIPASVHALLVERLDRQAASKEIAQVASMIGRSFSYSLLSQVTTLQEHVLRDGLSRLVDAGLLLRRGEPPLDTYTFKHALVQEAAAESLLISRRRELNNQIAAVLERDLDESVEDRPAILARHYAEAGEIEKAVFYAVRAAETANARSAFEEAANVLRNGLRLLKSQESPSKTLELELLLPLGTALIAVHGVGSDQVERAYARALDLCAALPESELHFAAHWGWWRISKDLRKGRKCADDLLKLAERLNNPELMVQAHHASWASAFHLGDHRACLAHVERGLRLQDETNVKVRPAVYGGHDVRVCAEGEAALSLWLLGFPGSARDRLETALARARVLSQADTLAHALDLGLVFSRYRRDVAAMRAWAAETMTLATAKGFPDYVAKAKLFGGWVDVVEGRSETGIEAMMEGMRAEHAIATPEDFPIYCEMLAEAFQLVGRTEDAVEALGKAFVLSERHGANYWEPELLRRKGLCLLDQDPDAAEEAQRCFLKALEIARNQGARMLQLRAAMDLARLYRRQGRPTDASALLVPLLDEIEEGHDEIDLQEAITLARSLRGPEPTSLSR